MRVKNRLLEIRLKMGYKFQKDFAEFFGESAVDIARAGYVQNICTGPRMSHRCHILNQLN